MNWESAVADASYDIIECINNEVHGPPALQADFTV